MYAGGPVYEPDDVVAGAGPPHCSHVSTTTHREREFSTGGTESQKYGMDAVADLSDGVGKEANAHEGVEP
jgi:hypothetical protein